MENFDPLHIGLFVVLVLTLGAFFFGMHLMVQRFERIRKAANRMTQAADTAIYVLDELARDELRTAESMQGLDFSGAAGNARLRGLEVYRNGYVDRYKARLKNSLEDYHGHRAELLAEININNEEH